jgi:exoribonuclease R
MLAARDSATGMLNMRDMVKYMGILPPSFVTTKAGPHVVMGIKDGYTRATSPLRRYFDFVVHWQIKSRLMGKELPFSAQEINVLASTITTKEKQLSLLQERSTMFWVISLLDRLRGFTDTMEWNCIVNMPARVALTDLGGAMDVTTGTLLELGVRGRIEKLDRHVDPGDICKVRITGLDPMLGRINLELI